nr:hypothetical protein OG461_24135 [Streptomyces sp. NBC_00995]
MSTAALAMTAAPAGALTGRVEVRTSQGPGGDAPAVAPSADAQAPDAAEVNAA